MGCSKIHSFSSSLLCFFCCLKIKISQIKKTDDEEEYLVFSLSSLYLFFYRGTLLVLLVSSF
jgi:hypothetical protein